MEKAPVFLNLKRATCPGYNMAAVLTVYEMAEKLKTTPQQIRKMIRAGILPAVKVGREYRITEESLSSFLNLNITE